ncbi:gluconate:H+ symporter [Clostridium magnum]|uniref:DsdX permease n=1 Tax=Clostridium magnum DSM 2767 TaxID=1121326 RepID=A0A161XDT4_9CLOT|nr:gluconate:H+ symporter [Clostridium magnum]KZL92506.1 DsdX permease [Clostridium magnum DSM 2767]SHI22945.1 gluconate:H+ symporter, GntP family [Clostridium magnum DSM 2767]
MSSVTYLVLCLLVSIALIIFLIMKTKLSAFIALTVSGLTLGILAGMPLDQIAVSFQKGMGNTLGFLATVLGLGTILGKMLEISGGAQRLSKTLIGAFGEKRTHWAMMVVAFICGIPVFLQVGLVLLMPVIFSVARQTKMSLVKIGVPVATTLTVVHCMVPPHPAALAIVGILKADVGTVIMWSLIVGLPAAMIGGPIFGNIISKYVKTNASNELFKDELIPDEKLPKFGITLFTILLPMIIMVLKTIVELIAPKNAPYAPFVSFVGNPITALLISVIFSYFSLGFSRGLKKEDILKLTDSCFGPVAGILLVIGAGGAFNQVLQDSGIGKVLGTVLANLNMNLIVLAWVVALVMRATVGSGTVAMMTAAGIILPLLANYPGVNPAIVCVAIGAGAIGLSHVNDSGFWTVKEFYGMTVQDALKCYTTTTTIASVVALIGTLILSNFV